MNKNFNNKSLLNILLMSVFTAGMLYMLGWLLSQIILCWSSEEWPETKGTITYVEWRRESSVSSTHGSVIHLDLDVKFEWKSEMYHTDNQGCNFDIPYRKLRVGKEIPVFVNESNPEKSILSKGIAGYIWIALGMCLLFSVFPLVVVFKEVFHLLKGRNK